MADPQKPIIQAAPWAALTYRIIGLAMEVHNELGPGHAEAVYHNALAIKLRQADIPFGNEPYVEVTLDDGTKVRANYPDFVVDGLVIVEIKGRSHLMTRDDMARVIRCERLCQSVRWPCSLTLVAHGWSTIGSCRPRRLQPSSARSGIGSEGRDLRRNG